MAEARTTTQELMVTGSQLVKTVREIIHEGNIRRITLRSEDGHTLLKIPLTAGVAGAMLLPFWTALGAFAALASGYHLEVEKVEPTLRARPSAPTVVESAPQEPH
jgi:hypothetical protein